jgi:hypothetical protein
MPSIDFGLARESLDLDDVLGLLHWIPRRREPRGARGDCPLCKHVSRHRGCFAASKKGWYCNHCRQGGNALDLYSRASGLPFYESVIELFGRLNLPVPWRRAPGRVIVVSDGRLVEQAPRSEGTSEEGR